MDISGSAQKRTATVAALVMVLSGLWTTLQAQWLHYPSTGIPRTRDGKPDLLAQAPRAADGRPDLSGIWQPESDPTGMPGGIEGAVAPRYLIDVTRDLKPSVPFTPWAETLYRQRAATSWKDNPLLHCLPAGVPRLDAYTRPYKIVQTSGLMIILYESQTMFRQVFTDGRGHPKDPEPTWMGYSIGKWDADALVVDTIGFNDQTWLDGSGHPHSDAMHLVERFTRRTVGHMDIDVTIEDPKAYTKPLSYRQAQRLLPDTELLEYVCENEKDVAHVGKPQP